MWRPDLREFLPTPSEGRRKHTCFGLSLFCIQQQVFIPRRRTSALFFTYGGSSQELVKGTFAPAVSALCGVSSGRLRALSGCVRPALSLWGGTPKSPPLGPPACSAHHLPCALQEGGVGHCVPCRRGAIRRDPGLLLAGGARPIPHEAVCGHRRGYPAVPQRCVCKAFWGHRWPVIGPCPP